MKNGDIKIFTKQTKIRVYGKNEEFIKEYVGRVFIIEKDSTKSSIDENGNKITCGGCCFTNIVNFVCSCPHFDGEEGYCSLIYQHYKEITDEL